MIENENWWNRLSHGTDRKNWWNRLSHGTDRKNWWNRLSHGTDRKKLRVLRLTVCSSKAVSNRVHLPLSQL
jgi:hypothetical protein